MCEGENQERKAKRRIEGSGDKCKRQGERERDFKKEIKYIMYMYRG